MSPPSPGSASAPGTSPEQRRAAHALRTAKEAEAFEDAKKKAYRSYVERVGTTILTNGLGQALATELAAAGGNKPTGHKESAHRHVYLNLQSWLCGESGVLRGAIADRRDSDLLGTLVTIPEPDYLRVQAEALAWLVWHKKLCRALLPRGEED